MLAGGLSPKTIDNYTQVVKMVVASAVDKEGEQIYQRKWNHEFIDMPLLEKAKQNTSCFSSSVMTGLATWKYRCERTVFILCVATGSRIGEALGLEIGLKNGRARSMKVYSRLSPIRKSPRFRPRARPYLLT